jgi:hypothetical protein
VGLKAEKIRVTGINTMQNGIAIQTAIKTAQPFLMMKRFSARILRPPSIIKDAIHGVDLEKLIRKLNDGGWRRWISG